MTVFALVHGAWHGPWCWDRVTGPLREHGHDVVVPDLPSEDPALGLEDYADVIERDIGDADDVVLVPHSLGGLVGPVVAARRPLRALVYVCGLIPEPGRSFGDQLEAESDRVLLFEGGREVDDEGRSYWPDRDATRRFMYSDLEPADADWAFDRLRRQARRSQSEPSPAVRDVRVESIIGSNDRAVSPDWSRRVARDRLGVEPIEMPTGHFPMITHPQQLADELARLAAA